MKCARAECYYEKCCNWDDGNCPDIIHEKNDHETLIQDQADMYEIEILEGDEILPAGEFVHWGCPVPHTILRKKKKDTKMPDNSDCTWGGGH